MNKTKQNFGWNKVTPLSKYLAMLLFIILPFLGFWLGTKYRTNSTCDSTLIERPKPTMPIVAVSKSDMISRGIHPDPVDIKVLNNVSAQWQDESVAYVFEKAYLTPDIADLGSSRNNSGIKDKSFLIVELSVRDRRTTGDKRQITASKYLRIRKDQRDMAPAVGDYLRLSPQENGTVYVSFPVERNVSQFNLSVGILARPRIIQLNFDSSDVSVKKGIFILKKGYFPEYSPDLHP